MRSTSIVRSLSIVFAMSVTASVAHSEISGDTVRIGVLADMNGIFSDNSGVASVTAAEMAVEDFGGSVLGKPIEILSGDHQNKPDIASNTAREWVDERGVDVIADIIGSSVTYAVLEVAKEKGVAMLMTGAGASDLTGPNCSPISVHWVWDSYSYGGMLGQSIVEQGSENFYFITVDYSFGVQLERDVTRAVEAAGAKVTGGAKHPFGTTDFSSLLLSAQSTGADALFLANAGGDTINAVKQAHEFGLPASGITLAAVLGINEMRAAGPQVAQGVLSPSAWYWALDEDTKAFARRFAERSGGKYPTEFHAGVYSSVSQYLKAVEAAGTDDAETVIAKMKELSVSDVFARNAKLRADGRLVHDMYVIRGKAPGEAASEWDVAEIVQTIPGEQVFRPMADGGCPIVASD